MKKIKKRSKKIIKAHELQEMNLYVAGVDIGSEEHFIAVSPKLADKFVRSFATFTSDLKTAIKWLKELGITSVAMESTGVYWIPFFEMLDAEGFEVLLVNAQHAKNVPGRKSDVLDCQWIQKLHAYGLLRGSFRPSNEICILRGFMRQRETLIKSISQQKLRMQKALTQMNILLHNVISEVTGDLGLKIIQGIIAGNHDPKSLASLKTEKYKSSKETIEKALEGNYRQEHIFSLKQCFDSYVFLQEQLKECDVEVEKIMRDITLKTKDNIVKTATHNSKALKPKKRRKNELFFDPVDYLRKILGIDLSNIPGLDTNSILKLVSEIGTDISKWKSSKHFTSWLGLSSVAKISGGEVLSSRTQRNPSRAAKILRLAAFAAQRTQTAIGAFYRRQRARLGAPAAITATARKIAVVIYEMLSRKVEFKDLGSEYYEQKYKARLVRRLEKTAMSLGYSLIQNSDIICTDALGG